MRSAYRPTISPWLAALDSGAYCTASFCLVLISTINRRMSDDNGSFSLVDWLLLSALFLFAYGIIVNLFGNVSRLGWKSSLLTSLLAPGLYLFASFLLIRLVLGGQELRSFPISFAIGIFVSMTVLSFVVVSVFRGVIVLLDTVTRFVRRN